MKNYGSFPLYVFCACSNVDDVLLEYIADVFCGLGEGGEDETSFDVEQFSEMISAYVPEFATVQRSAKLSGTLYGYIGMCICTLSHLLLSSIVCVWVFEMVDKQRNRFEENKAKELSTCTSQCAPPKVTQATEQSIQREAEHDEKNNASDSMSGVLDSQPSPSDGEIMELLREMFPDVEIEKVLVTLRLCGGDVDQTIQRLLGEVKQERVSEVKREKEVRIVR